MDVAITPIEVLQALYPDPFAPGKLMLWSVSNRSGKQRCHWLHTAAETASRIERLRSGHQVFFSLPLHDPERAVRIARRRWPRLGASSARGCQGSATALPALWLDLDVAGWVDGRAGCAPGTTGAAGEPVVLPPDRGAAFELFRAVPVPPSIIVSTGGGYHVYWLLREPWLLETDEDRARAAGLLRRLQWAVHARAQARGWSVPHRGDLGDLVRVPSTYNRKYQPAHVVNVIQFPLVATPGAGRGGDFRYTLDELDGLPEPPAGSLRERFLAGELAGRAMVPADFGPMLEGCEFLGHCAESAESLSDREYALLVGLLARSALAHLDGARLVHRFSQAHTGYNWQRTEERIEQALRREPPDCRGVEALGAAAAACCRRCRHHGRIEAPFDLGRPAVLAATAAVEPAAVEPAAPRPAAPDAPAPADRPVPIRVTTREQEVAGQVLAGLAERRHDLFRRGGRLVSVASSGRIEPVRGPGLRQTLTEHFEFWKPSKTDAANDDGEPAGRRLVHPPRWLHRALLARGSWPGVPELAGVVEHPVLTAAGTVLERPGYDPGSRLLYAPTAEFEAVAAEPDRARAVEAAEALLDVVADFPFRSRAHRVAWLASLLTPLARPAFRGPAPLHLIDANAAGCGKSLLVDVVSTLLTGRNAARTSNLENEAELRKAITAIALDGSRLVLIDNVAGALGSPTLDRALTAETWRDRLLGSSTRVTAPLDATWYATGTNVALAGDTARRCLPIRLETTLERPEERTDLRRPRLLRWVRRKRAHLVPQALTLLRAFVVAGRPARELAPWGSFEGWSDLVRGTLVWLGLGDPAATREGLETAGGEREAVADLVSGLEELLADLGGAATTRRILERLAARSGRYDTLRSALESLIPQLGPGEPPTALQLAGRLRAYRGRMVGGACIDQTPGVRTRAYWTVRRAANSEHRARKAG